MTFLFITVGSLGATNAGLFNISGRGSPDIAAPATNVLIVQDGTFQVSVGTSASCPIVTRVVALLNNARLNAGIRWDLSMRCCTVHRERVH